MLKYGKCLLHIMCYVCVLIMVFIFSALIIISHSK
jgi:hypothetical protein